MKLEPVKVRLSLARREESVESSWVVCIELIDHHPDAVRIRVVDICEFDHPIDPFNGTSPVSEFDVDPPGQWFCGELNPLFAVAFVSVIDTSDRSRFRRERIAFMSTKCFAGLVETDDWAFFVVGFVIEVKNVLHVIDEVSVLFGRNFPVA